MIKSAAIVLVGDELLSGMVQDTNSSYIAQKLVQLGVEVKYRSTVPDDPVILEQELRRLVEKYDIVITSGGLGTTQDDITKKAIATFLGRKLVLRNRVVEDIRSHFPDRGGEMPPICYTQALVPQGAIPIRNPGGAAPGLAVELGGKWLMALPGVPSEMEATVEGAMSLLPKEPDRCVAYRTIRTTGIAESKVQEELGEVLKDVGREISFFPTTKGVDIRLNVRGSETWARERLKMLEEKILSRIDKYVYGRDRETLEQIVGHLLAMRELSLSVAESCTGGLVKHLITNVSGSSKYFLGGVVAYHNDVKEKLLGVPQSILADHGAVSKETVIHMAKGVRELLGSDIGIGVTGVAGPAGATPCKSVGLIYIGLSTAESTQWGEHRFSGDRVDIKEQSAQASLDMLRRYLLTK